MSPNDNLIAVHNMARYTYIVARVGVNPQTAGDKRRADTLDGIGHLGGGVARVGGGGGLLL